MEKDQANLIYSQYPNCDKCILILIIFGFWLCVERYELLLSKKYENTDQSIMTLSILIAFISLEVKKPSHSSLKINFYRKVEQLIFRILCSLFY